MMTPSSDDPTTSVAPEVLGFTQFEFALTDALIQQLIVCLDDMSVAELNRENLANLPNEQGVYQLFLDGQLQYVGKTDRKGGLRQRLNKHFQKLSARPNLRGGRVTFKAVQVLVFTAVELEGMLIKHYEKLSSSDVPMAWQHSGFGSNDPGKRRDETVFDANHFDSLHPIDIDEPTPFSFNAEDSIGDFLSHIKSNLAYTLRFQNDGKKNSKTPHKDLQGAILAVDGTAGTVREALKLSLSKLPKGWQAVNLPGYVIMYKNDKYFPSGKLIAKS